MSEAQTPPLAPIIGIAKEFADPGTGAVASYHVVVAYQVDLRFGGTSAVTFASYVSRETQQAGRQPLAHITLPIKAAPTGDSAQFANWFAERVLAGEVTLQPGQTEHPLSGGVAVRGEEPA